MEGTSTQSLINQMPPFPKVIEVEINTDTITSTWRNLEMAVGFVVWLRTVSHDNWESVAVHVAEGTDM